MRSSFPAAQRLAAPARLVIVVRNTGPRTMPEVAVTVDAFSSRSERTDLADAQRPVWIIDRPPAGSTTAYTNTWALGRLAAGRDEAVRLALKPVQPGTHRLRYRDRRRPERTGRRPCSRAMVPEREVTVRISARPARARVDPGDGRGRARRRLLGRGRPGFERRRRARAATSANRCAGRSVSLRENSTSRKGKRLRERFDAGTGLVALGKCCCS